MKKIVFTLFMTVLCSAFIIGCEQEDVAPKVELKDLDFTEEDGSEPESGGVRPKAK